MANIPSQSIKPESTGQITKKEFLEKIRNKYPQAKDANDEEVISAFLKKYPVYKSKISDLQEQQTTEVPEKKGSAIKNIAKELALSLPRVAATFPAMLSEGVRDLTGTKQTNIEKRLTDFAFRGTQKGTKERAGSAAMSALDVGSWLVPIAKAGQGISATKAIAQNSATSGLIGAGYGASNAMLNDLDPKKQAFIGAVFGAALPLVAPTLGIIGSKTRSAAGKTSDALYSQVLKEGKKEILKNESKLSTEMARAGIKGNKNIIQQKAEQLMNEAEDELQSILSESSKKGVTIDMKKVAGSLDDLIDDYSKVPGESRSVQVLKELKEQTLIQGKMDISDANAVKRALYKIINKEFGKDLLESPVQSAGQKILAKSIKKEIERNAISKEVSQLNQQMGIYGRGLKAVKNQIASDASKPTIGMSDLASTVAAGFATGDVTGGLAFAGARRILGSDTVKTNLSVSLRKFADKANTKIPISEGLIKGIKLYAPEKLQKPLLEVIKQLPVELRYIYFQLLKEKLPQE